MSCNCAGDWISVLELNTKQCGKYRTIEREYYRELADLYEQDRAINYQLSKKKRAADFDDEFIERTVEEKSSLRAKEIRLSLFYTRDFLALLNKQQMTRLEDFSDWQFYGYPYRNKGDQMLVKPKSEGANTL